MAAGATIANASCYKWYSCSSTCRPAYTRWLCRMCVGACYCASPVMDLARIYDSGVRLESDGEKYSIVTVASHSQAAQKGLEPGDQVLEVNGVSFTVRERLTMESLLRSQLPGSVDLKVSRGKRVFRVRLRRDSLLTMLDRAWVSQPAFHRPYASEQVLPFVAGLRLEVEGGRAYVRALIPGSPAALAGLEVGDEVAAINNGAVAHLRPDDIQGLLQGYRAKQLSLRVKRPQGVQQVTFRLAGLTRLVNTLFQTEQTIKP